MTFLNDLLEYQKVDSELRKIEQEISSSPERKKFIQAKKFMETAPEKLEMQDHRAVELKKAAQALTVRYLELQEAIKEFSDVSDPEKILEENVDVAFYKGKAQQLADNLRGLRAEIDKLVAEIKAACEEYDRMKKQTIEMQNQYKEYNKKFKELRDSRKAEMNALNAKLSSIAKNIPADVLERYTAKRKEKIFPIVVELKSGVCLCGMGFAIQQMGELEGGALIECEHCRRLVFRA